MLGKWGKLIVDRKQKALHGITKSMRGLEIGPSYQPVAAKREGWNVQVIDHVDREALRKKYGGFAVDIEAIEEVDFICVDNDFLAVVPEESHGSFDYIISSHMIEHTPNLIQYLRQMEKLLVPEGVLSLIVPDKRFCFDFFRPLSTTADVLYAEFQGRQRHSIRTAFEMEAYYTRYYDRDIWDDSSHDLSGFTLLHTVERAYRAFSNLSDEPTGEYRDLHCWKFTPASFRLIILELQLLGKLGFSIKHLHPTEYGEFCIQLIRGADCIPEAGSEEAQAMRLALLREIQHEMLEVLMPQTTISRIGNAEDTKKIVKLVKAITPPLLHPLLAIFYRQLTDCHYWKRIMQPGKRPAVPPSITS